MKVKRWVQEAVDVASVRIGAPVKYGEEDMPHDFPGRGSEWWEVVVDAETGRITTEGLAATSHELFMKVTDEGKYELLDESGGVLAVVESYVPEPIPNEYGDYLNLVIGDGVIANWPKRPDFSGWFPGLSDH